jgi:hypothetical protein
MKPISGALFVIKDLVFVKLVNQMGFDLSQYETVDERLHKWFEQNPNARVYTELISWSDTQQVFTKMLTTHIQSQLDTLKSVLDLQWLTKHLLLRTVKPVVWEEHLQMRQLAQKAKGQAQLR